MTPDTLLTIAACLGLFAWIGALLTAWCFCVAPLSLTQRIWLKVALVAVFARVFAATVGDMPLDYLGASAWLFAALIGCIFLAHHIRRVFKFGDRCSPRRSYP